MKLRDYQEMLAQKAFMIIADLNIVYLSIEMRVGKTIIALRLAELLKSQRVLFVTKKKAINSIESDYKNAGFSFMLDVTNYEQLGKINQPYDVVIADEAHSLAAYPKPSIRAKELKRIVALGKSKLVLSSGTPTPETYTQIFHQFWVSPYNPFNEESFYRWAREFVNIKERIFNGFRTRDYSDAKKVLIMKVLDKYFVRYTQKEAGFIHNIDEQVILLPPSENVLRMVGMLKKYRYYRFTDGNEIKCDSAVKLQSKIHQAYSGTIKTESGVSKVIDISKALYIQNNYKGKKIAVFYKFIAEGEVLKKLLPNWTDDPEKFNSDPSSTFICQIVSGSMGVNLSSADILIFYNIDFSALQYWQARARLQNFEREMPSIVHWLFMEDGIEQKVYNAVLEKKDYTLSYFRRDFNVAS